MKIVSLSENLYLLEIIVIQLNFKLLDISPDKLIFGNKQIKFKKNYCKICL